MNEETRRRNPQEPEEFAARIRAARAYAGMTRPELAEAIGRSKSTVERIEKGDAAALGLGAAGKVARLVHEVAQATGLPTDFFFRDWWQERREGPEEELERVGLEGSRLAGRLARIERRLGITTPADAQDLEAGIDELLAAETERRPGRGPGEDDSRAEGGSRGR